ncbi:MAG TPA: caspase family protein [Vicinamibacterales bacterium]|nr:caspase family protein [Vicinamibacterales bacterium]
MQQRDCVGLFVLLPIVALLATVAAAAQSASGTSRPSRVNIGPVPPQLVTTARFVDLDASGVLKGLETARLEITVENRGDGAAKGVTVDATSDTSAVTTGPPVAIGELAPGARREVTVPLTASIATETGRVAITLRTREADGNDAPRIQVMVPIQRIEKPGLEILSVRFNDRTGGLARGNGNGIVENGETIEIVASIRNAAAGEAKGLKAELFSTTRGVQLVSGLTELPLLSPGVATDLRFAVDVAIGVDAADLRGKIEVTEGRGLGTASRDFSTPITKLNPALSFDVVVRDGQLPGTRGNGNGIAEFAEIVGIEVTPVNKGSLAAEDVRATISTAGHPGLVVQRPDVTVGTIPAGGTALPLTFLILVQNSANAGTVQLPVELSQRTFASVKNFVKLDIRDPGPIVVDSPIGRPATAPLVTDGPRVIIDLPEDNQTVPPGQPVRLSALVNGQRVARIEVLVDGRSLPITASLPSDRVEVDERLTLGSGVHQIVLRAFDTSSRVSEKAIKLTVAALGSSGDLVRLQDLLIRPVPRDPNAYAVVIGIGQYREKIPAADFAAEDAIEVKRFLEGVVGVEPQNIRLMTNEQATRSDIEDAIEEWLPRVASSPSSRVFVYFSGHGTPADPNGGVNSSPFIVPYEGAPGQLRKLYSIGTLYRSLGRLPTRQVHVWIDACFSGVGERSVAPPGARPFFFDGGGVAGVPANTAALLAAAGDEYSNVWSEVGHGLFTYYLLRGLSGEADQDRNGSVTLGELYAFLARPVEQQAGRMGRRQTPMLAPSSRDEARRGWVVSRQVPR